MMESTTDKLIAIGFWLLNAGLFGAFGWTVRAWWELKRGNADGHVRPSELGNKTKEVRQ